MSSSDNTLFQLKNKERYLSTGCTNLDIFLNGGISCKGITQVYGESGVGKTQLALQLSLAAQIPNNDSGGVAYICTESAFPSNRLHELFKKSPIVKKYPCVSKDKIFVEHISNTEDLENCIFDSQRLPMLLSRYKIKLLIIDSIAATYRAEYDTVNLRRRAKSLRNIGYQLQNFAKNYKLTIICINQVTAVIRNTSFEYNCPKIQPSLGITWASMITNSLYMYKRNHSCYICIVGSPQLSSKYIEFQILDSGISLKY